MWRVTRTGTEAGVRRALERLGEGHRVFPQLADARIVSMSPSRRAAEPNKAADL